jgi:hypothetical protein
MAGKWTLLFATVILGNSTAWGGGVECLREMGPQGLDVAIAKFHKAEAKLASAANAEETNAIRAEMKKWRETADQVAAQRDAVGSRLYWCTDLEHAKEVAAKLDRPILSLRLLGKLTDEFSCANSRYFRTVLYANKEVGEALREKFVLHWQSVRPVPKVTIDFGDGRKLERTITGNSAHYVLSADGYPIDVLPGLYGPQSFLRWLQSAERLHGHFKSVEQDHRQRYLAQVHAERLSSLALKMTSDLRKIGRQDVIDKLRLISRKSRGSGEQPPTAWEAEPRAFTKAGLEVPILRLIRLGGDEIETVLDDKIWQQIAALHRPEAQLDPASVKLIRDQHPAARQAGAIARGKGRVEDPILRLVRTFEDSIAQDSVRNEYLLHRQIHAWFAAGEAPSDFDQLNERVYSELFLTPSSDPWLGLAPSDAYTALENGGLSVTESR